MSALGVPKIVCLVFVLCLIAPIAAPAQVFRGLLNFNGPQGAAPVAPLIRGPDGNLYGATAGGGASFCSGAAIGCGVIFKLTSSGTYQILYTFCQSSPCNDGAQPYGGLVQGNDGNFYGTTYTGGSMGGGTIFKITPDGVLTTLHEFCRGNGCPDGSSPLAGLVVGADGNFYGTTSVGPGANWGSVFRITPSGDLTTLHAFSGPDGLEPFAAMILATDGNFYGTTWSGGASGVAGTIFKISPSGAFTSLYSFCQQGGACLDGYFIYAPLVQGADGDLYGTSYQGGNISCAQGIDRPCGTVFKITLSGSLTTVHTFNGYDGAFPEAGLALGVDGNFYGTTTEGGSYTYCPNWGCGTVFRMTPGGAVTVLHSFNTFDGTAPLAGLLPSADGTLYGTTWGGGSNGNGTVFSESISSTFYQLTVSASGNGTVTSADQFINCPGSCSHSYTQDIPVTLTANPAPGWSFSSWSGACSGSGTSCTVTMNQSQSVRAVFVQDSYTLTTSISGQGTITSTDGFINCPGVCSHTYLSFTPVTLNASAAQGWNFSGWSGACTGVGPCNLTMLGNYGVSAYFMQPGSGLQLVPVTPCRLVDTRANNGGGPIGGGTYRTFNLTQLAQANGCADLSAATAYSLNVTLVPLNHAPVSYLTIWPAGLAQPVTSTMNSRDGRVKANAAIVPDGTGGVNVYVTNTTNLILDIDGYLTTPSSATLKFYPITPCRVADTRSGDYPPGLGTPNLFAQASRDFPVLSSTCIPANVTPAAYSLNLTAIPYPESGNPLGYLEVWPTGQQPQNPVSTLNNPTGTNVANAAIVPAGTDGKITAFASNATDLAIDIDGYFAASGGGGLSLYPAPPCRVFDTRGIGQGQPFTGLLQPPVDVVASVCAPPSAAQAYVFNATVIPSPTLNYLTLWPDSEGQPTVSTLNAGDGWITSNMAIVPNVNGKIDAYARGLTQLILDISAYFAP